jgi:hypothetical protein
MSGVFVWMDVTATGDADSKSVPVLCVFVSLWTTLFLEFWKRKQKTHALMWGHTEFRAQEQMRPNVSAFDTFSLANHLSLDCNVSLFWNRLLTGLSLISDLLSSRCSYGSSKARRP